MAATWRPDLGNSAKDLPLVSWEMEEWGTIITFFLPFFHSLTLNPKP